jgi:hypothetical protein
MGEAQSSHAPHNKKSRGENLSGYEHRRARATAMLVTVDPDGLAAGRFPRICSLAG